MTIEKAGIVLTMISSRKSVIAYGSRIANFFQLIIENGIDHKRALFAIIKWKPSILEIKEKSEGTKYKLNDKLKYDLNATEIQLQYDSNITQTQ